MKYVNTIWGSVYIEEQRQLLVLFAYTSNVQCLWDQGKRILKKIYSKMLM